MTRLQHPQHPYDKFFLTGLFADALVSLDTAATAATGACCPVHRIVLAAHSPVLCQLLTSPPARHHTHTLDDCQSSVVLGVWLIAASDHTSLRLVLEWCYFADLSDEALTPLNCWALRETALQLQIDPLVRHVDDWIAADLLIADTDFGEDWALALKGALRSDVSDDLLARIVDAAASKSPPEQDGGYFCQKDNSNWEYQKYRYLRRTILREDLGLGPHEIRRAFAVGVAFTAFNVPQLVEAHADEDLPRDIIAEALMRSLILRSNGNDSQEQEQLSNKDDKVQPPSAYYSPVRSPQQRSMNNGMASPSARPPPPPPRLSRVSSEHPVLLEPSPAASASPLSRQGTQDTIRPVQPRQLYDDTPMSTVLARLRASSLDGCISPTPRVITQFPEAEKTLNANGEEAHGDDEVEPHPGDISTYELAAEWPDGESDSPVRAPIPLSVPPEVAAFCGQKAPSSGQCSAASTSPRRQALMAASNGLPAVTIMERRNSFGSPVPAENTAPVHGSVSASPADWRPRRVSIGSTASAPREAAVSNISIWEKPRSVQQKRHSFHGLLEGAFGCDPQIGAPEPIRAGVSRNSLDKSTTSSFNSTTAPEDDGPMQTLLEIKRQVRLLKDRAQQDSVSATMPCTSHAHAVLLTGAGYDHAATVPRPGDRSQFVDLERLRLSTPMVLAEVRRRFEGVPQTTSTASAEGTPPSSAPNDAVPLSATQAPPTYAVDPATTLSDFTVTSTAIAAAPPPPPKPVDRRPRQVRKQISFAEMPTLISPDTSHDDGEDADDDEDDEFYAKKRRGGVSSRSPPPPAWGPTRAATPSLLLGLPLDAQQVLRSLTSTSMDPFNMTAPPRPGDPRPPRPAKPNAPRQPNPSAAATWAGPPPSQFIPNSSESSSVRVNEFAFLDVPTAAESGVANSVGSAGVGVGNGGGGGTVNGGGGTHKGSFRMLGFNAAGTVARAVKAKKRKGLVDLFKSSA
ncbi:hypothetical protein HDU87_000230 [Geranomyces variabilis]|uniref:BTB domain-containing protein n=1 Tax=Geranomyces variabilis TaxID=109894 RepID=A0AAD5XV46_9FUNG|nr:hypothetical protein HDU87_000230 [Geranomyces variabilis]